MRTLVASCLVAMLLAGSALGSGFHVTAQSARSMGTGLAKELGGIHFGLGIYTPFGLPMRWDDRDTFSGRHVSYLLTIRTINVNPTVCKASPFPPLAISTSPASA